jgi:hypothetical protein
METAVTASDEIKKYITRLEQNIIVFEKRTAVLERKNRILEEKLKPALFRQFDRHAAKFAGEGQLTLFDAGERAAPAQDAGPEEKIAAAGYQRKKHGRKPLDEKIPRVEEATDIPEEEKQCACGSPLAGSVPANLIHGSMATSELLS